jgi:orotate phosphoribosyltransferase/outer membrane protein assembly factor BamB
MKEKIRNILKKEVILKPKSKNNYHIIDNWWNWIFDFRKAFLNPVSLDIFCKYFWNNYEQYYPFQVWGIESWAIPLVSWIILEWLKRWKEINGFYVRKTRKEKWLWNIIEWNLWEEKIIIVDDLLNWWESIFKVFTALNNLNKKIFKVFVFINYWNPKWQAIVRENNLDLWYIFTLSDFWLIDYMFWNSSDFPIVFPKFKKLIQLLNQNLFLDVPKSNPILFNEKLLSWWESGNFICIHKDTWDVIWETILPKTKWHKNILSSPIIVGNEIIFWNYDWNIYLLDINTGKINFVYETIADFIWSSPCYDYNNDILFIWLEHSGATNKWSLFAIDNKNKKFLWEKNFTDFVHCSPAFLSEKNFVICWWNDWKVVWVNSLVWKTIFELKLEAPIKWGFVFSEDGKYTFFGTHDYNFYKVEISSWKVVFKVPTKNIIYAKPLIVKDSIFFGSLDKSFYHINWKTWKIVKVIDTYGKIFWEPILIEKNIICFTSNTWYIYFYDTKSKKVLFTIYHWEKINNKPIYEKQYWFLYIVDHVGWVYKYNIKKYIK